MTTPTIDPAFVRERLTTPFARRQKVALVFEILRSYVRVRRRLAREPLPDVLAGIRRMPATKERERAELDDQLTGIRLGRAVGRTLGALPADGRCLVRSLVLTEMLAQRGIESKFLIGVRPAPSFEAHAWVEKGDVPLLPAIADEYERLVEL
jgi:transglutaminase superfamily protein